MTTVYDGIILGAGHNGMILQAYLGKAGLRTVAIDRNHCAGGGLATLEDPRFPGFLHNTHAFFQRAITVMPWYADLDLARHGATYIEPELNVVMLTRDGRALEWWTDFERTAQSFASFNPKDAATLRRWRDDFVPIVSNILTPEGRSPPLPKEERRRLLERSAAGRRLLAASELSPLEFVEREFVDPAVKAGLLFFNGLREVDLRLRGFGHHIPALLASPAKAQMSRGGSAALARALESAVRGERRRNQALHHAETHRGRERQSRRGRDDHRRGHSRPPVRCVLAQSASDLPRSDRAVAPAARAPRQGRGLPVQSPRPAVRPQPEPARAAAL